MSGLSGPLVLVYAPLRLVERVAACDEKLSMLTRSSNAIIFDNGGGCVEMRRMPDGRWTVATGISVIATGKTPWMPATRTFVTTRDDAMTLFLDALPHDAELRANIAAEIARSPP